MLHYGLGDLDFAQSRFEFSVRHLPLRLVIVRFDALLNRFSFSFFVFEVFHIPILLLDPLFLGILVVVGVVERVPRLFYLELLQLEYPRLVEHLAREDVALLTFLDHGVHF